MPTTKPRRISVAIHTNRTTRVDGISCSVLRSIKTCAANYCYARLKELQAKGVDTGPETTDENALYYLQQLAELDGLAKAIDGAIDATHVPSAPGGGSRGRGSARQNELKSWDKE